MPRPHQASDAAGVGVRAMGLASGAFLVPLALFPITWVDQQLFGHVTAPTWGLLGSAVLVLLGLWLVPSRREALLVTGAVLLASVVWWSPQRYHLGEMNWWAPGFWAIPWVCWAVTVLPRRVFRALSVLGVGFLVAWDLGTMWLDGVHVTPLRLAPMVWFAAPVLLMSLFAHQLFQAADEVDRQVARRTAAERSQREDQPLVAARREAHRLLHDHVLHALHALSLPPGGVPSHLVTDECRTAVAATERVRGEAALVDLTDLLRRAPVLAGARADLLAGPTWLPSDVAHALSGATQAALGNVVRHARAQQVQVRVEELDQQWRVDVVDDGVGFDTASPRSQRRLGLRRSVHERMEDVGGSAQVTSRPGQGTRVRLLWPAADAAGPVLPEVGSEELGRALRFTALPVLLTTPFMAVLAGGQVTPSWPLRLVAGLLFAWGLWWTRRLREHRMGSLGQAMVLAVTTAAWWLNLALAPDQPATAYALWIGWTGGALVHLAVLQVPLRRGVAMLLGWNAVQMAGLVWRVGPHQLAQLHIALTTGLAEGSVTLFAIWWAGRIARQHRAEATLASAMVRVARQERVRSHVEQFWSARVTDVALPLLRGVADGTVDALDPAVQSQARLLEATLRDELVMGPGHARLLDTLGRMRRDGWTVRSGLEPEQQPDELARLALCLDALGAPHTRGQLVTLSATQTSARAVVLDADQSQAGRWQATARALDGNCLVDPDFVLIQVPLRTVDPEYVI